MVASIEPVVRKFIAESFIYREGLTSITDDDSLLEKGLIDSTGVLELVFFIEKNFGVKVADDEVVPDNLDSVRVISDFIRRKTNTPAVKTAVA